MPVEPLEGKRMAGSATGTAQENPLQVRAVAHGESARSASIGGDVVFMSFYIVIPFDRMLRKNPAQMALRTRGAAPLNPVKVGSMTVDVGTAIRAVQLDIGRVQGVGEMSPLEGMDRLLVAKMTLGTGDTSSPSFKIIPMAIGAYQDIGLRSRFVSGRQPIGRVNPAHGLGLGGPGTEVARRIRIPPTCGQQEDGKQQQRERLQRSLSYP